MPAWFRRADLVVLPYREIDQSGVLFTALAFGKPLLLTSVGGFPEVAESGAAELVVPGDPSALHIALRRLLDDPGRREALAAAAREAAATTYSWDADRRPAPRALRIPSPRQSPAVTALEIAFWACAGLLVYAQLGYGAAARRDRAAAPGLERRRPSPASHPTCR